MTPEQALEIVKRFLAGMSPENLEWWLKEIAEQEEFLRKNRWLFRWRRFQAFFRIASRFILLLLVIIAILLWIRACNELNSTVTIPTPSGVACTSDGVDKIYRFVYESSWKGCRTSMNQALQEASIICQGYSASCTGAAACSPQVCAPGVVVKDINQTTGWVSCDTAVGFTCDCGCR